MFRRPAIMLALAVCLASRVLADGLPSGDPRGEGFSPEALAKIRPLLEKAVEGRKIAGGATMIVRRGKVVHLEMVGMRDLEAGKPIERSTLYRIASMSKPITSAAVMILVDDGKIKLDDPVSKFLPEFASMTVAVPAPGGGKGISTRPATRPITIAQLLTHTSGLTYRFVDNPLVGPLYVESAISDGLAETPGTIGDNVRRLARLPLIFEPGAEWSYSLSIDVLGRVIEVASGRTFDQFLRERLFGPLKMDDTGFLVPAPQRDRLAACYYAGPDEKIRRMPDSPIQVGPLVYSAHVPTWDSGVFYSGGAGLTSSLDDYARFLRMILGRGELDGVRVLKPETVDLMRKDQISPLKVPGGGMGEGFSYGFGVVLPGNPGKDPAGEGALSWAGFFGTHFWVDVQHDLIGLCMTQAPQMPNLTLDADFKRLTYEALADK